MKWPRQLFAFLLVVLYASASTLGMAFVVCVEADGTQIFEAAGAACCANETSLPAREHQTAAAPSTDDADEDCGDCLDHLPAIDIASRTSFDEAHPESLVELPPPALPGVATPTSGLERPALRAPHAPPRPPAAAACLRSVVLRC